MWGTAESATNAAATTNAATTAATTKAATNVATNVATNEVAEFLQRQGYQTTTVEPLEEATAGFGSS